MSIPTSVTPGSRIRTPHATTFLAGLMLVASLSAHAFDYTDGNMLLCMRYPTGGTDVEVNLGAATAFNNLAPGSVVTITNYLQNSISDAFGGDYTTVDWAAFGCVGPTQSTTSAFPNYSLWLTRPRTHNLQEGTPWVGRPAQAGGQENLTVSQIETIGANGADYSSLDVPYDPSDNNASTVLIPSGNINSYSTVQVPRTGGQAGNFQGDWYGDVETLTPNEKAALPWVSRADLFFVPPVAASGTFLGCFEFKYDGTNGILTFQASDGPAPVLTNLTTTSGSVGGGTSVTLNGTNFFNDTNLVVEFGSVTATSVTFNNSGSITAVAPANNLGTVSVVVINSDGQYSALAGAFTYVPAGESGALQVTIQPTNVVTAGATWQVDGGTPQASGAVVSGLDVTTNHTVTFSGVTGWTTPGNQSVSVTNAQTNSVTGIYAQQVGSLTVTITPTEAVTDGATWQLDGTGPQEASGATVSGIPIGSHSVNFSTVTGFGTPANQNVTITNGQTTSITGNYPAPSGSLQVAILPPAVVAAGAMWQLDNAGPLETNGAVVSGLDVSSNHTVTFTSVAGWTPPADLSVSITNNTTNMVSGTYVEQTGAVQVSILPAAVVSAGAEWQVDGGAWQTNGAVVSNLSVISNHIVAFTNISGWTTPTNQTVSVFNGATTLLTDTYISSSGFLEVTITPTNAIGAGALWQVNGGPFLNSGALTNLSSGSNLVSFGAVSGWNTPSNLVVMISNGQTTMVTVDYIFKTRGIPTVAVSSPKINSSISNQTFTVQGTTSDKIAVVGVFVQLNGTAWTPANSSNSWKTWSADLTLSPGSNTLSAYVTDISGSAYTNKVLKFQYIPSATLAVLTNGDGTFSKGFNGSLRAIGTNYTISATPAKNWLFSNWVASVGADFVSNSPILKFTMQSNLVLTANFVTNLFNASQGTYHGLFAPTNAARTQSNSGSFSLRVMPTGAFSGTLQIGSTTASLGGTFDVSGAATVLPAKGAKILVTTMLQLNLADQTVQGTVTGTSFDAILTGDQAVFTASHTASNYEGSYTFIIPGTNDPTVGPLGTSYGTATVGATGTIAYSVHLADGTTAVGSSFISKDGMWPFYVPLYSGNGSLWGWNSFSGNGNLVSSPGTSWINITNPVKTALYRSGFTNQAAQLNGSLFNPTVKPLLALTNAQVTLDGGNLPSSITNQVALSAKNIITLTSAAENTNHLLLTISPKTGIISGSFANPANSKQKIALNGVLFQSQTNATGYFLGTSESGQFLLENSAP